MELEESNDWNVEQYRHPWDCDEHWEIRREFILAYKDRFPEDKLVCLAQVYANIEILGCSYPAEVTKQVSCLAAGLENRIHKKKDQKIKFVKSTDSEEAIGDEPLAKKDKCSKKAKYSTGEKSLNGQDSLDSSSISINQNRAESEVNYYADDNVPSYFTSNYRNQSHLSSEEQQASSVKIGRKDSSKKPKLPKRKNMATKAPNSSYINRENIGSINLPPVTISCMRNELKSRRQNLNNGNIVGAILKCATKAYVSINFMYEFSKLKRPPFQLCTCILTIDHIPVAKGRDGSKKSARIAACNEFVKNLFLTPCIYTNIYTNQTNFKKKTIGKRTNASVECSFIETNEPMKDNKNSSEFIIIEQDCHNVISNLMNSAAFNKKNAKFEFVHNTDPAKPVRCNVFLDDNWIASANESSRQMAKTEACRNALEHLKKFCPTIRQKVNIISEEEVSKTTFEGSAPKKIIEYEAIPETNIGNRLMRLMGWTGGGLGKEENGIEEPIRVQTVIGRCGLGAVEGDMIYFRKMIRKKLEEYASSDSVNDLVFDTQFTKEERKEIHLIAQRYNLKSASHGKGEQRSLVVSRKWTPLRLFDHVRESGGSTDKYELIPPENLTLKINK